MDSRRLGFVLGVVLGLCPSVAMQADGSEDEKPLYKDATAPVERRVDDLLRRMTLEEKVMQVNQYSLGRNNNENNAGAVARVPAEIGSVIYYDQDPALRNDFQRKAVEQTRLGIPVLFGHDVIHGFRTITPIPLAQSCSWNPELVTQVCAQSALEASRAGVDWTFSPMIDVAHDPRWGRVAEGYGEDPYATGVYAAAAVRGYQGDTLSAEGSLAACLKHFVGYGASEAGRDYVYTEISRPTMWNLYLPPYEAGVRAGAATLMSSFNDVSGTPSSASHFLMTEVLKERWGHRGFVVSDWDAVRQLINQGVAADGREAALKAFNAGLDMDMMDDLYQRHLPDLVNKGLVPMERLDGAVRRVLRIKFEMGLFENPYTKEMKREKRILQPEGLRLAEQMAEQSIVLLKNENAVLPLERASTIALIGPLAKDTENLLGSWFAYGEAKDVCPIDRALSQEFEGRADILYAQGCGMEGDDRSGFAEAVGVARRADVVVLCLGEKRRWSGENAVWGSISLPEIQEDLLAEVKKAGKPVVLVLSNGRPLDLSRMEPLADAIVEIWQPGVVGGKPLAGVLSGRVNPSGRLSVTFPRSVAQIPIYYNRRPAARKETQGRYLDMSSEPLYEFGAGLSFTTYDYGEISLPKETLRKGEEMTVEVRVSNSGPRDGMETVMWFVSDPVATLSRPVKELKHFEKKLIKAGEEAVYRFTVNPQRDLSYRDAEGNLVLEAGDYYLQVKDKRVKFTLID